MMNKSGAAGQYKLKKRVLLTIVGQDPFEGIAFLTVNQRLIDLLNDDRQFIPIEKLTGEMVIVSKFQIASIIENRSFDNHTAGSSSSAGANDEPEEDNDPENEDITPPESKTFDPYAALRISRGASLDEIRSAYKLRIKAVHPDAVAGLDLDEDLKRAALQATQRVNYAYKRILAEHEEVRKGASHDEDAA